MRVSQRNAMTLIEVTIVILVLGIVAAVSVPRISLGVQTAQLRTAVAGVESHLAFARATAMNRSRSVTVTFDNANEIYSSTQISFPEKPDTMLSVDLRSSYDPSMNLDASFDGLTAITFDPEGMPLRGTSPLVNGTVHISAGGVIYRIEIKPGLGIVSSSLVSSS
jgi:prepilin-type N-terminal cleavage/methylation domain-containing protein